MHFIKYHGKKMLHKKICQSAKSAALGDCVVGYLGHATKKGPVWAEPTERSARRQERVWRTLNTMTEITD